MHAEMNPHLQGPQPPQRVGIGQVRGPAAAGQHGNHTAQACFSEQQRGMVQGFRSLRRTHVLRGVRAKDQTKSTCPPLAWLGLGDV